ncbi:MAG: indolepyruvate ferredoxin oxidoreductase [Planctomycetes bacterium]|nr:indolepyruvate ferredoxin oxidoreductase [Planctomycetota bacterium]
MAESTLTPDTTALQMLLGDEAVAFAAIDAGIAAAYAYPGTPSTEITECLLAEAERSGAFHANWCANEKTAMEAALGVSMVGGRAIVSMKHVGLNVAADPFMNAALTGLRGGVVVAVADDPGMHSSQNEQDSRVYAEFARTLCLEPGDQQEAYAMTREAFELSERFQVPVVVRLVTRLCHGRAPVLREPPRAKNPIDGAPDPRSWILLPANARRLWRGLLDRQPALADYSEHCGFNTLVLRGDDGGLGIITTGAGRNHYLENLPDLERAPSHLHIGAYPLPKAMIRRLCAHVERLLILEEGYPVVERALRGVLQSPLPIFGKEGGPGECVLPLDGELTPGTVRKALGLPPRPTVDPKQAGALPTRPPQLCEGCPHRDAYAAISELREELHDVVVAGDIGCYTLGALPPYRGIDSCVCMGASIGMAKGAADAGHQRVLAVIGDSTFLHSGVTPLMDAVSADTNMTLLILDNQTVAMTGTQPTVLSDARLGPVITGLGVPPEHCHVVHAHPKHRHEFAELVKREVAHQGLSVIVVQRECIVAARRHKEERRQQAHGEEANR